MTEGAVLCFSATSTSSSLIISSGSAMSELSNSLLLLLLLLFMLFKQYLTIPRTTRRTFSCPYLVSLPKVLRGRHSTIGLLDVTLPFSCKGAEDRAKMNYVLYAHQNPNSHFNIQVLIFKLPRLSTHFARELLI